MCFSKLSTLVSFLHDIRDGILFFVHIIKTFTFVWIMTGGTRVFAIYPDRYLMGHFALDLQRALHFRNFNLVLSIHWALDIPRFARKREPNVICETWR